MSLEIGTLKDGRVILILPSDYQGHLSKPHPWVKIVQCMDDMERQLFINVLWRHGVRPRNLEGYVPVIEERQERAYLELEKARAISKQETEKQPTAAPLAPVLSQSKTQENDEDH